MNDNDKNQLQELLDKMEPTSPEYHKNFMERLEGMGKEMKVIMETTPWHKEAPILNFIDQHYDFPDYVTLEQAVKMRESHKNIICPFCEAGHVPTKWTKQSPEEIQNGINSLIGNMRETITLGVSSDLKQMDALKITIEHTNRENPFRHIEVTEVEKFDNLLMGEFNEKPESGKPRNFKDRPSIPNRKRRWKK